MHELDRREAFLLTAAGLTWTLGLGGCDKIFNQIKNRPVRRDGTMLSANHAVFKTYREGIQLMRQLGKSDPRNWRRVAEVHLNFCPHGNWYFLPWHRAYLMMIENIIRELTGEKSFAMPYWDWRCRQTLPAPFWQNGSILHPATNTGDADYAFTRDIGPSDGADPSMVGTATLDNILNEPVFELFASGQNSQGNLEGTPHNHVHGSFIGGTMGNYLSPLDPVFWLHHCVLDYFWFEWNSRGNANTGAAAWVNHDMTDFVDGQGNSTVQKVAAMPLAPLLAYRYESPRNCTRVFQPVDERVLKAFLEKARQVPVKPVRIFPISPRPLIDPVRVPRATFDLPPEAVQSTIGANQRLLLQIADVVPPPDDKTMVRVFVNLPEGGEASPESPNYAGTFAFFTDPGHPHAYNTYVDLTPALRRLGAPAATKITFVAVSRTGAAPVPGPVRIGRLGAVAIPQAEVPRPLQ